MAATTATSVLDVRLLGGFAVAIDGRQVPASAWRGKRIAGLVKLLAIEPSHRLHREQVLESLWPELDPDAADNNLRYTLHEARKRLSEAGAERHAFLAREGESLSLGPADALSVDVDGFEHAAAAAWRSEDPALTAAALERYPGDLLPDDPYEEWTESRRAALQAAHRSLIGRLAELHLKRGEGSAGVAALERLVAVEPSDEAAQVRLMKVLARTGQRKRALAQYDHLVALLERDVGAAPEPATTRLRDDIAAGRYPPPRREPAAAGPIGTAPASLLTTLPAHVDSFIGRDREVAEIGQLLSSARLVTLTGPGGVGKTRLALAVAHERADAFPDGIAFVDLAPLRDPALILPAIAHGVGVREEPGVPLLRTLQGILSQRQQLLILDNFEHLVAASPVVTDLLSACARLKVLATSRVRLRLRGEREYPVGPLALPEPAEQATVPRTVDALATSPAVVLFVERAQAAKPAFTLAADNAADVAAICHRLDGLPLAIELAAAWVKLLPPAAMRTRLQAGRLALTGGARDLPERQQTIRNTIAWSYDLLTPEQQRLFRCLAVFLGGWTIEAAEAVGLMPGGLQIDVLEGLRVLVDQSLVVEHHQPDDQPRFTMLETIREFGLEQLAASEEEMAMRDAHATYCLHLAEAASPELERGNQVGWYRRLDAEHPNMRAAIAWLQQRNDAGAILRLGAALWLYWFGQHAREGLRWLEDALAMSGGGDSRVRAAALHAAGNLARALDDPERGEAWHRAELALRQEIGDDAGIGKTLLPLGLEAFEQEDVSRAKTLLLESAERLRAGSDAWALSIAIASLGHVALHQGDLAQAKTHYTEALDLTRRMEDQANVALALTGLGDTALAEGDARAARRIFEECLALHRVIGRSLDTPISLGNVARTEIDLGNLDRADTLLEEALSFEEESTSPWLRSWLLLSRGRGARLRGDRIPLDDYREALRLADDVQSSRRAHVAECLDEVAAFAAPGDQGCRAVTLWGAADHLRQAIGLWWRRSSDLEKAISDAREVMGEVGFAEAWEAGRTLSMEPALAEARVLVAELIRRKSAN